jgi:hypothetical protein
MSRARWIASGAVAVVLVSTSSAALEAPRQLVVVSRTPTTITLRWPEISGASEYLFLADARLVARSDDGARREVTFASGARTYAVEAITAGGRRGFAYVNPLAAPARAARIAIIEGEGTVEARVLMDRVRAAVNGKQIVVRPRSGADLTVTGDVYLTVPNVTIQGVSVAGIVSLRPGADDATVVATRALGFEILGPDRSVIAGNRFDGQGVRNQNVIWDEPAGDTPNGWVIRDNEFRNFFRDDGAHSEALFIGYSKGGLIERNTFVNNGNTSHIFFSWYGNQAEPWVTYPRNICVRGNRFGVRHGAYYDINIRPEIPLPRANIVTQRNASTSEPRLSGKC